MKKPKKKLFSFFRNDFHYIEHHPFHRWFFGRLCTKELIFNRAFFLSFSVFPGDSSRNDDEIYIYLGPTAGRVSFFDADGFVVKGKKFAQLGYKY